MKPNKENSMLIDIQYINANKREDRQDVLYMIWKNLDTGEKYLQSVVEPKMDIFFEKQEFRNHDYNKTYQHIENLDKVTVKYRDIIFRIAEEMGDVGKRKLSNIFETRSYGDLRKFHAYPYAFGTDFDIKAWYRARWIKTFDNDRVKKISKGFLDIEADGYGHDGMPIPTKCPINAVTVIDASTKNVHTFVLTGQEYIERNTDRMTPAQIEKEMESRRLYASRTEQIDSILSDVDGFINELHDEFDENYPGFNYNLHFYSDERKMLVHLFQLINILKLDMIGIWNMPFDIPYIMERLEFLGLDPIDVMTHPDFDKGKECRFKFDTRNFAIKNKSDYFYLSSYTIFYDQMVLYAAIRKGQQELRSHKLNYIAKRELRDEKLNYSEEGDFKLLPYINFRKFIAYNIKDVLLQYGIEMRTTDCDTLYVSSYKNATPYDSVFKQTVKLRNVQMLSFEKQGLIPGNNVNVFNMSYNKPYTDDDDDNDDEDNVKEGAVVARPELNSHIGLPLYGMPSNSIFRNCIDMDMGSFYPNSIIGCNIDPSTLIFKMILPRGNFKSAGMKFKEYISPFDNEEYSDDDDIAKEVVDNLITRNYMSTGYKVLNLPSVDDVYYKLKKKLS